MATELTVGAAHEWLTLVLRQLKDGADYEEEDTLMVEWIKKTLTEGFAREIFWKEMQDTVEMSKKYVEALVNDFEKVGCRLVVTPETIYAENDYQKNAMRYVWLRDLPEGSTYECIGNQPGDMWDDEIDKGMIENDHNIDGFKLRKGYV